jgi:hypothetical protein
MVFLAGLEKSGEVRRRMWDAMHVGVGARISIRLDGIGVSL